MNHNNRHLEFLIRLVVVAFFFTLKLHSGVAWAKENMYQSVRHLGSSSGLSHNTVRCIHQDRQGFMWFGTRYGLNRFDGHEYRIYHNTNTPGCIGSESILCIEEDAEGCLWVGTENGVFVYDPHTETFHSFDVLTADEKTTNGCINDICITEDGLIWIISDGVLYCYNQDVLGTPFNKKEQNVDFMGIYSATLYHNNSRLYYSFSKGLFYSQDNGNTFNKIAEYTFEPSPALCEYGQGRLLIGSRAHGLYILDIATGTMKLVPMADGCDFDANDFFPYVITRIDDDSFVVGSEWGLFTLKNGELSTWADNNPTKKHNNAVFDIFKDREEGLWVATNFTGVKYYPHLPFFRSYMQDGSTRTPTGNVVRAIAEDAHGNLWIGTEDAGLCFFDGTTHDFAKVVSDDGFDLSQIDIQDLTLVGGNKLAMGTYRSGLYLYNIDTGSLAHYMDNADVFTVYERHDHSLLFAVQNNLYQFNLEDKEFYLCKNVVSEITDLVEDHLGRLWLARVDGILCYDPSDSSTKEFSFNTIVSASQPSYRNSQLFIDSQKCLWVANGSNGLYCYDEQSDAFEHMTMEDGLPSNAVNTLAEDENGRLWVGTNDGLAVVDIDTHHVIATYNTSDGMPSNHVTLKSAVRLKSGDMAFGTFSGLLIAQQSCMVIQKTMPPVTLIGLYVYDEEILPKSSESISSSSILQTAMPFTKTITLPSNKQTFTLLFTTFNYQGEGRGQFAYRLDGQDRKWNYMSNRNQVSYHNVPPGHYTFRICSIDGNTHERGIETQLAIRILSPWWKTVPMRILYLLLFAFAVYLAMRTYQQRMRFLEQLRVAQQEKENEKKLYQAKIDFFTNIAHELRTPASLIKDPLSTLRKKGVSKDIDSTLALVERNAENLNSLINEILDFRKVEAGFGEVNLHPENFNDIVLQVWEEFHQSAEGRVLHTRLSLPELPIVVNVDVTAIKKILRNLFSNALKFAESYIHVVLDLNEETDNTRLSISNDGKRIPADMRDIIFKPFVQIRDDDISTQGTGLGLSLALSLAKLQGGTLFLDDDAPDNTFVLQLPLADTTTDKTEIIDISEKASDTVPTTDDDQSYLLVVEDHQDLRAYLTSCLSETYSVLEASNGVEALQMLRNHQVQLVLSDVMMPYKDGLTLCRDIKTDPVLCHIPVALLTAKNTETDYLNGLGDGADIYIGKPFSMEKLKAQIASLLLNRQLIRDAYAHDPQTSLVSLAHTPHDERFLAKATEYIMKHIDDSEWNVDDLADCVGMSRSSLNRKLKAITMQTPNEFIRLVRLRYAAELLSKEHYRLNEVCVMVGFSNPHYFSTLFQHQFGMKPSDYAQKFRK